MAEGDDFQWVREQAKKGTRKEPTSEQDLKGIFRPTEMRLISRAGNMKGGQGRLPKGTHCVLEFASDLALKLLMFLRQR